MAFSDSLREKRLSLGLSQQALADLVGSKKQNIAAYEQGRAEPSNELLLKLSQALNTTPSELIGTELTKAQPKKITYWESRAGHFTEQERKDLDKFIAELLNEDNEEKRKNAMDVARVILKQGKKKKE